jgi:hypothetical protein
LDGVSGREAASHTLPRRAQRQRHGTCGCVREDACRLEQRAERSRLYRVPPRWLGGEVWRDQTDGALEPGDEGFPEAAADPDPDGSGGRPRKRSEPRNPEPAYPRRVHRRDLVVLVALAGCGTPGRDAPDAAVDALPDAKIDELRVPFTTTGTTPAGSLDEVRFIAINYLGGFCNGYGVNLYRTNEAVEDAIVEFHISTSELTEPPIGTIGASARTGSVPLHRTDDVTFEVVHLDLPPSTPLRLAGRMYASTGAWLIDFTIHGQADLASCL